MTETRSSERLESEQLAIVFWQWTHSAASELYDPDTDSEGDPLEYMEEWAGDHLLDVMKDVPEPEIEFFISEVNRLTSLSIQFITDIAKVLGRKFPTALPEGWERFTSTLTGGLMITEDEVGHITKPDELRIYLCKHYELDPSSNRVCKAFSMAWDWGHSSGCYEVANYFMDLVELITMED